MRRICHFHDDTLVHWAKHDYPNEACGVIVDGNLAVKMKNVAEEPEHYFSFDPEELIAVYTRYGDIDGVWHSHPNGPITPSTTDIEFHPPGKRMIIVAEGKVYEYGTGTDAISSLPQS